MKPEFSKSLQALSFYLFNVFVADKNKHEINSNISKNGLIVIDAKYIQEETINTILDVINTNIDIEKTFYKNIEDLKNRTAEDIYLDQILHYISTYGLEINSYLPEMKKDLELLGILKNNKLDIFLFSAYLNSLKDEKDNKKEFFIIDTISSEVFFEMLKERLLDSKAIDSKISKLLKDSIEFIPEKMEIFKKTKNKEVKVILSNYIDIEDPEDFIRNLIFNITGESMIVKNNHLYDLILFKFSYDHYKSLINYIEKHSAEKLSTIFNRYKYVFLAMKIAARENLKDYNNVTYWFNKISKLSKKHHVAKKDNKNIVNLNNKEFKKALLNIDIYSVVKIGNALLYDINLIKHEKYSKIYFIRNRKSYLRNFIEEAEEKLKHSFKHFFYNKEFDYIIEEPSEKQKESIKKSIVDSFNKKKEDKENKLKIVKEVLSLRKDEIKIERKYSFINYALPTSDKNSFSGIPSGSTFNFSNENIIFGVYWENVEGKRIDLDFSAYNSLSKIGWDADYMSENEKIIFSGDMTDAKNGASELIYFSNFKEGTIYNIGLNFYNHETSVSVPFKFFIANAKYFEDLEDSNELGKVVASDMKKYLGEYKYIESDISYELPSLNIGMIKSGKFTFLTTLSNTRTSSSLSQDFFDNYSIKIDSLLKFSDIE